VFYQGSEALASHDSGEAEASLPIVNIQMQAKDLRPGSNLDFRKTPSPSKGLDLMALLLSPFS